MLMRRILVPVDFSPRSRAAVDYAFHLAALAGAEVDVVHVVAGPGKARSAVDAYLGRPMPHAAPSDVAEARARLHAFVDGTARCGIVPHLVVETGDVASAIVRLAAQLPADLVVLGTRGHRGFAELLLGSVAHKVITCAGCPVVTLPQRLRAGAYEAQPVRNDDQSTAAPK
jgi:nucleotide-binding universal stress UspA family protein